MQPDSLTPEVIVFDLGGVLMNFGGLDRLADISGYENDAALRERWVSSPWPAALECGRCTADEFARGVVADWEMQLTPNEFLAEFASWPAGPFAGALDMIRTMSGRVPMGCLSNTNPVHWQGHLDRWGIVEHFDWTFVSHELGMMKPDPKVYQHVIASLGVAPERVLFLDDWEANVIAAVDQGIRAVHVCGIDEVRTAISQRLPGLL